MTIEAPPASSHAVHNVMMANRSKDTKPEIIVRKMLREYGYPGYRLHWRIDDEDGRFVCRPDVSYPGRKFAIFVHGCFWHRCPACGLSLPKSNVEYWKDKFERNQERDARKESSLSDLGWSVHTIWECEIGSGVDKVVKILSENSGRL